MSFYMQNGCSRCNCTPCVCCIPGPTGPTGATGATGATGPAGTGTTPIYGGMYSLSPFITTLQPAPVTIIPTEHDYRLSGTQFVDGSLQIPSGVYLIVVKTFATAATNGTINTTITLNGTPIAGGQIVQRTPVLAGVGTQIYSTFYDSLAGGLINIAAWGNQTLSVEFFESAIYMVKIADF